jgi:glycerophosphoryl diester phosphodiesterase
MNTNLENLTAIRPGHPLIIAHRGIAWSYPENTMPSYHAAIEAGADLVELDFHPTADGVLACVHDDTVGRCLDKTAAAELRGRRVTSFTWDELRRLDVGIWKGPPFAGTRVPALSEVLDLFLSCASDQPTPTLLIEQKEGMAEQTVELLRRHDALERVIVQSFHWDYLTRLHVLAPNLALAALGGKPVTPECIREIINTGARTAHWHDQIRSSEIDALHAAGLSVWTYTLNSELAHRGAALMGIDGIATDRCDLARQVLASRRNGPVGL